MIDSRQYRLTTDFATVFAPNNEMNAEIIFAVQLTRVSRRHGGRVKYRFFPIPAASRATNPELTQNPGW